MIFIQVALSWPLAATGGQNIVLLWNVGNMYIFTYNVHKKFIGIFLIHRQIQLKIFYDRFVLKIIFQKREL